MGRININELLVQWFLNIIIYQKSLSLILLVNIIFCKTMYMGKIGKSKFWCHNYPEMRYIQERNLTRCTLALTHLGILRHPLWGSYKTVTLCPYKPQPCNFILQLIYLLAFCFVRCGVKRGLLWCKLYNCNVLGSLKKSSMGQVSCQLEDCINRWGDKLLILMDIICVIALLSFDSWV